MVLVMGSRIILGERKRFREKEGDFGRKKEILGERRRFWEKEGDFGRKKEISSSRTLKQQNPCDTKIPILTLFTVDANASRISVGPLSILSGIFMVAK